MHLGGYKSLCTYVSSSPFYIGPYSLPRACDPLHVASASLKFVANTRNQRSKLERPKAGAAVVDLTDRTVCEREGQREGERMIHGVVFAFSFDR